jgi:serine phosphatase RsbU (regulator of sigma subunit)
LEALIRNIPSSIDVRELVTLIIEQVHSFMGEAEQHDDLTLVAIQPTNTSQSIGTIQELELEVHAS